MKKKMCEKRKGRWLAPHRHTGKERTQMLMEVCLVECETSFLALCEILSKSNITIFFVTLCLLLEHQKNSRGGQGQGEDIGCTQKDESQ